MLKVGVFKIQTGSNDEREYDMQCEKKAVFISQSSRHMRMLNSDWSEAPVHIDVMLDRCHYTTVSA